MNIILATSKETPDSLDSDDDFLINALESKAKYSIKPWGYDYTEKCVIVIRSTWDYHKDINSFLKWAQSQSRIINPYEVILWNCDKNYLLELANIVDIIPTKKIISNNKSILSILQSNNWVNAILKPSISLGSLDTIKIENYNVYDAEKLLFQQFNREFMLQPFIDDIKTAGEISIIFIDGTYSHAVRKIPKRGDFRSQPEFGSVVSKYEISDMYLDKCNSIMKFIENKFSTVLLYARIDFIDAPIPLLIELELIEPCLYFNYNPASADLLVDKLLQRINKDSFLYK